MTLWSLLVSFCFSGQLGVTNVASRRPRFVPRSKALTPEGACARGFGVPARASDQGDEQVVDLRSADGRISIEGMLREDAGLGVSFVTIVTGISYARQLERRGNKMPGIPFELRAVS